MSGAWTKSLASIVTKLELAGKMGASVTIDTEACRDLAAVLRAMSSLLDLESGSVSTEELVAVSIKVRERLDEK